MSHLKIILSSVIICLHICNISENAVVPLIYKKIHSKAVCIIRKVYFINKVMRVALDLTQE